MHTTQAQIESAVAILRMPEARFRAIPAGKAKVVLDEALTTFVKGGDRRWWWEAFAKGAVYYPVINGFELITSLVPIADSHVWFVAEDDQLPDYPLFDATPSAIQEILGECFPFEYYLIAKDMSWILCENHHDYLIGVGEPVATRLSQLSP